MFKFSENLTQQVLSVVRCGMWLLTVPAAVMVPNEEPRPVAGKRISPRSGTPRLTSLPTTDLGSGQVIGPGAQLVSL